VIPVKRPDDHAATYLVGGGIASLAAAVFLIRDGDVQGHTITILEESSRIGGSLDAAGNATDGYVMRGGRMIESKYLCTYDLFSSIPTLDGTNTATQEIFDWNNTMKTSSKPRLFRDGHRIDSPSFGMSEGHILTLERLALEPESLLGRSTISDQFAPDIRFPALAWRGRVQTLPGPLYAHGVGVQHPFRHYAYCIQPVRFNGPSTAQMARRARREVHAQYNRN